MVRTVMSVVVVVAGALLGAARADDEDAVKERLFAAKVAYDAEMGKYRKAAGEWFDQREDDARRDGNKKLVDQIKSERAELEDNGGGLPATAPAALKQRPADARKALEAAYAQAVKEYVIGKKDAEAAAVETEWKTFAKGRTIDLLALVDVKAHALSGEWKRDETVVVGASGEKQAWLRLPYEPGEEYDLNITCRRTVGKDGLGVGLVAGGRQVVAYVDSYPMRGYICGFEAVDGKQVFEGPTAVKGALVRAGKDNTVLCSVRADKISIVVNGKAVSTFRGNFSRLSLSEGYAVPNKKALFLFVGPNGSFQIDHIEVTPVKGRGTVLK